MRTNLIIGALLAAVVAGGTTVISLRRSNTALRQQVNEKRSLSAIPTVARETSLSQHDIQVKQSLLALGASHEAEARLRQLRSEVAELEQKATRHYAANSEPTDAPSSNRDPEKGMTRLEHLQNVGQGTPGTALQTLFWAAIKGEEQAMARTIGWDEGLRPQVQALIERLPEELRARYPTPEALTALFITKYALDVSAIHISETVPKDAANVSLTVKGLTGRDEHLPMRLGPNGWQLVAGEPTLKALGDLLGKK